MKHMPLSGLGSGVARAARLPRSHDERDELDEGGGASSAVRLGRAASGAVGA